MCHLRESEVWNKAKPILTHKSESAPAKIKLAEAGGEHLKYYKIRMEIN